MRYYLPMDLPLRLQVDASGGTLRFRRWDAKKKQLSLHVFDAHGEDIGVVRFAPVTFVCLPTKVKVERMEVCDARALPGSFWTASAPSATTLRATDWVIFVHTPDHLSHYVIASGVRYDRNP